MDRQRRLWRCEIQSRVLRDYSSLRGIPRKFHLINRYCTYKNVLRKHAPRINISSDGLKTTFAVHRWLPQPKGGNSNGSHCKFPIRLRLRHHKLLVVPDQLTASPAVNSVDRLLTEAFRLPQFRPQQREVIE